MWYAGFRSLIVVLGMFLGSNFFCCLLVFVYACNEGYFWRNGDDDEDAASDLPSPNVARMFIEQADNSSYALITYHLSRSVVQMLIYLI